MKIKLLLLGLVVALLAVTNPGMEDFKEIAAKKLQEELAFNQDILDQINEAENA